MSTAAEPARRRYRSTVRSAQAVATRNAIVDAARGLFTTQGYAGTSIDEVATAAGVSRRTVYDSVGSKRELLLTLLERMAPQAADRFGTDLAAAAGDARTQLALGIRFVCELYEQGGDIVEIARAAGSADADLQELAAAGENGRLSSQRGMVGDWSKRGLLRPGLTRGAALDILWAMTSPAVHRLFVVERGWSRDRFARWLLEVLQRDLLGG